MWHIKLQRVSERSLQLCNVEQMFPSAITCKVLLFMEEHGLSVHFLLYRVYPSMREHNTILQPPLLVRCR